MGRKKGGGRAGTGPDQPDGARPGKPAKAKPAMTSSEVKRALQAVIAIAGAGGPIARQVVADPIGEVERQVHKLRGLLDAILRPHQQVPAGKKKSI